MFRHVLRTYFLLSRWSCRPARPRTFAALDVTRLEERATPDATSVMTMPLAPQSVMVAPAILAAANSGGLSIPMAGQSRMTHYADRMTVQQLTDIVAFLQSQYTERPAEPVARTEA